EITKINKFNLDNPEALKYLNIKGSNIDIRKDAFRNTGIEELILDGSCTLNSAVFLECKNLKRVEFTGDSPTVKISDAVFRNCTALEEIVFSDNVDLELSMDSLGYCTSLKELTLNGKIRVNSNACRGCDSLEKITLSGDVKLYSNSFTNNRSLTDIIIDTDKTIEGNAFNDCSSLMNINSVPVFDTETKQFSSEMSDFVMNNFNSADNVGFINMYIQARTDEFIDEYIDSTMNDMQKIKAVHDWICNNVHYDYETTKERKNHNDASVFMNDSSVCEGYAKCYNILLNAAGIETYYVMSENHAWNVIRLGGHYFHSDTTWDDSNDAEISYDWFLRSDDEVKAETSSHSSWKLNVPSPLHSFQSAELPLCEYSMGDINTDGDVNVADLVQLNKYIVGKSSVTKNDIVLADLNYDGVTDVFDMVCMRKIVAGIE
ncbi:MAG: leucine-rich repeat protein, partial [Ruminococcus sp.]|nr:leucine-rich repeat protein [Ruminococcus sp.]